MVILTKIINEYFDANNYFDPDCYVYLKVLREKKVQIKIPVNSSPFLIKPDEIRITMNKKPFGWMSIYCFTKNPEA